jgi:ribosomal protein S10
MAQTCFFTVESKNKKSIFNFLNFFESVTGDTIKSRIQKKRSKKQKYKKITLLKSPHVHKSAQTQFESRVYKKEILIVLFCAFDFLILTKKLLNYSFYDIKITINFFFKGCNQKPNFLSLTDLHFNHIKSYSNNLTYKGNNSYFWYVKTFKTYHFFSTLRTAGVVSKFKFK